MAKKKPKKQSRQAAAAKNRPQGGEARSAKKPAKKANGNGNLMTCRSRATSPRAGRQGAARRAHSRFHPRAVGSDLHAIARLDRRRRDQGRAPGRGRHHARTVARRAERRQPVFHHAQRQQALDHHQLQAPQGHGHARGAGQEVRRAGGKFRARRARPHGADLGAHPQAQPAHDRRLGQGLRPGAL